MFHTCNTGVFPKQIQIINHIIMKIIAKKIRLSCRSFLQNAGATENYSVK